MDSLNVWSVTGAVLTSLGGGALIVAALFKWLGEIAAKRILQKEQGEVLRRIEELKHELAFTKASYEKHMDRVIDYYDEFYGLYTLCQRTSNADIIRHPDREDLNTKKDFLDKIDYIAESWNRSQGVLKLLLPNPLLDLHEEAIGSFNYFKDAVQAFDKSSGESRKRVQETFADIHKIKEQMTVGLREYLRTEKTLTGNPSNQ